MEDENFTTGQCERIGIRSGYYRNRNRYGYGLDLTIIVNGSRKCMATGTTVSVMELTATERLQDLDTGIKEHAKNLDLTRAPAPLYFLALKAFLLSYLRFSCVFKVKEW